jgi:hypothetical protein
MKALFILSLFLGSAFSFGQAASGDTTTRYPSKLGYDRQEQDSVQQRRVREEQAYESRVRKGKGTVPGEKVQDGAKDNEIGDNSTVPGKP